MRLFRAALLTAALSACIAKPVATSAQGLDGTAPREADAPLWELGVGAFGLYAPDYPASGEYSLNGLPFPYLIYRGDLLRLGEDAPARLVPVDTPRFEVGLSVDAAFGADSDDNELREDLPDLDPLAEIGPELIIRGPRFPFGDRGVGALDLALQGRAVFSVDLDDLNVEYRGAVFEPLVRYRHPGLLGSGSLVFASLGPIFATERLHDYFYEVDPQFARAGRPAFDADGGYLGTTVTAGLDYELTERLRVFTGTEVGFYSGAANEDSPLFEEEVTASVFLGFAYRLFESERRVLRGPHL